jgi:hypothetical protein
MATNGPPRPDSLATIERRLVREIGDALRRIDARMRAAEAFAEERERERAHERTRQSAIERANTRWFN